MATQENSVKITSPSPLPKGFLEASKTYVDAVKGLGLPVSFASCILDRSTETPSHVGDVRLLLVSPWADRFGETRLYALLFEAYEKAALPKEIEPFMVEILSEAKALTDVVKEGLANFPDNPIADFSVGGVKVHENVELPVVFQAGDYGFVPEWVIVADWKSHKGSDQIRKFKRFERNVHGLAA